MTLLNPTVSAPASPETEFPTLTFTRNVTNPTWTTQLDTLGSDHVMIKISVPSPHHKHRTGVAKLTDWEAFRMDLETWRQKTWTTGHKA
ncbi:hypothetical protein HPB48_002682 [Haemaphysalis longicornis]|uniref:Uncharacterized protein n=1 Tax=Haemaphysalis longicornis TaxID=44386 RepID=A0A9J6GRC1_HAELO|nr:hypothetical protein HPB48_002682 [Haemaphysalis longicornis]